MGARKRHAGVRDLLIGVVAIAAFLVGRTAGTFADPPEGVRALKQVESPRAARGEEPVARLMPRPGDEDGRPGVDIHAAWGAPPGGEGPRDGLTPLYDNGAPLDDWGDPASQWSLGVGMWDFIAASADDFEFVDDVLPETTYQITLVRTAFSFDPVGDPSPTTTWEGITVTVYGNSALNDPGGVPLDDGTHTGDVIASEYVLAADLLNETLIGSCRPRYQIDIPVNIVLRKNTTYWLSLVPKSDEELQTYWGLSEQADVGFVAHQGFELLGISFWTEIFGNGDSCSPDTPPAQTHKELSFALYGQETPPNIGACCNESTGICVEVTNPADCSDVFHPGTQCHLIECPPTGACCDDDGSDCLEDVSIVDCQGAAQRFAAGEDCTSYEWNPVCGTTAPGACCYSDMSCVEDLTPAQCMAGGGVWNVVNDCDTIDCPPQNDDCADAFVITGDGLYAFDTLGATTDGPLEEPGCTDVDQDIWFKYVATCTGDLTVSLCYGTGYDSALAVYDGCWCPPVALLGCDDESCVSSSASEVSLPVVAGGCYMIRIGGDGAATGSGYLNISCVPPEQGACCLPMGGCLVTTDTDCGNLGGNYMGDGVPCSPLSCPPPNDDCADAITLVDGTHQFTTLGATTDYPGTPDPPCTEVNQDIWFDYTATCTGDVTVSTCFGTDYDSAIAVYDGCGACPPSTPPDPECDDDGCGIGGGASEVRFPATQDTCYTIRVGGAGTASGEGYLFIGCVLPGQGACCFPDGDCQELTEASCTSPSTFTSVGQPCMPQTCQPPNDDCASAELISDGSHTFDASGATTDGPLGEPDCYDVLQDVWFEYTATCNGTLVANLCLVEYQDPAIAVYQGWNCPAAPLVGCNSDDCQPPDGHINEVRIHVAQGENYLIRVGGVYSAGPGILVVGCVPAGEGACCHEDYTCEVLLETDCTTVGDTFSLGEPCSPMTCPSIPMACCVGDANGDNLLNGQDVGAFVELLLNPPEIGTVQFCWANVNDLDMEINVDDVPLFIDKLLSGETCPPAGSGACCFDDDSCQVLTVGQCAFSLGSYQGDDTLCDPSPCTQPPAACCFAAGACQLLDGEQCNAASGVYQGSGTLCDPNPCPGPPGDCCIGDTNGDGAIDDWDVPLFLDAVLIPPLLGSMEFCRADVNEDLVINGADIAPFVQKILAGLQCELPANDDCASAELIPCNTPVTVDNGYATTDPSDPPFSCRAGGPAQGVGTLWYIFQATDTTALITTCGSSGPATDTLLSVYNSAGGCPFSMGEELACSEDAGGGCGRLSAACVTGLIMGNTYYIQVASYDEASRGPITLEVVCPCPTGACCSSDGTCQVLTEDACAAIGGEYLGDGSTCVSGACPTGACCFDDGTCQGLTAGACAASGGSYQGDDTTCDPSPCPPPDNDECGNAQVIVCGTQVAVDNTTATTAPDDPAFSCHFDGAAQGVGTLWFKFTATHGTALVSTCNSQPPVFDTLIAVYDSAAACPFTTGDELACSEDDCGRLSEVCVTSLTPGETYYIQVASFGEDDRGLITVDLTCPCP